MDRFGILLFGVGMGGLFWGSLICGIVWGMRRAVHCFLVCLVLVTVGLVLASGQPRHSGSGRGHYSPPPAATLPSIQIPSILPRSAPKPPPAAPVDPDQQWCMEHECE